MVDSIEFISEYLTELYILLTNLFHDSVNWKKMISCQKLLSIDVVELDVL